MSPAESTQRPFHIGVPVTYACVISAATWSRGPTALAHRLTDDHVRTATLRHRLARTLAPSAAAIVGDALSTPATNR
jgi:hypothetical protein